MMAKLTEMREKFMSKKKDNTGFTLVELIVVIVILAILVGVTIGGVYGYVNKSRINTDINNASAIASAMAPLTTMKGVTVSSESITVGGDTAVTFTGEAGDWTTLGLSYTAPTGTTDGVKKIKEMFPEGIPALKSTGAKYLITYTKGQGNAVASVMVKAIDSSSSALAAQE